MNLHSVKKINLLKSAVSFTPCTSAEDRVAISGILGVNEVGAYGNYLGMPSVIRRDKKNMSLQGWKSKLLSKARKDVLLRTMVQAMPNYLMSLFLLPVDICKDLETLMNSFSWENGVADRISIHWHRWKKMAVPKKHGGLGYRDLRQFNLALLAKQEWFVLKYPESMIAKISMVRYFPHTDFFLLK